LAAQTDDGTVIDPEIAQRFFSLPATVISTLSPATSVTAPLDLQAQSQQRAIDRHISERNARFFEVEATKLENWAEDVKLGLERDIKNMDRLIKEARRTVAIAPTLEGKLAGQKQIKALEVQRSQKRRSLFEEQDRIDVQRGSFIASVEAKLTQKKTQSTICAFRWRIS